MNLVGIIDHLYHSMSPFSKLIFSSIAYFIFTLNGQKTKLQADVLSKCVSLIIDLLIAIHSSVDQSYPYNI